MSIQTCGKVCAIWPACATYHEASGISGSERVKHVILFMEMNGCPYCYKMDEENFKHAPYRDFIQENALKVANLDI